MKKEEFLVLVDQDDQVLGEMEKMKAHREGLLHRAISVFIFNSKQEMLLQQRAAEKYHSPLLWTNTACTHPRLGESPKQAAERRLSEEMGMSTSLSKILDFVYKAELDQGLTEHEFDHVFVGITDELPQINPDEVESFKYMPLKEVKQQVDKAPDLYTEWFKIVLDQVLVSLDNQVSSKNRQ